jgi:hypothetical protein
VVGSQALSGRLARTLPLWVWLVCVTRVASAQQFDPAYRFRVLQTEHFLVYFHQGEDGLAVRLASIAEETWQTFHGSLGRQAPRRTHVVLVDQTDLANGWATPLPRETIAIQAVWPAASDPLKTDDWLRLAFTHEFTHILHLDRSEGWARVARSVFGRTPIAFPNVFLPIWQIEGLAVYEESAVTGEGRQHAGDFRAVVDEAARAGRLLSLDRVNGGLTRWPGGEAPYAYGLGFHTYLADRYGQETLVDLTDRTSKRLPYFGAGAFRRVFGKSLGTLWREYEDATTASVRPDVGLGEGQRLTHHDYQVLGPRFVQAVCPGCPLAIYYSVQNADEFPSMYRVRIDEAQPGSPERMTTRFFGSTLASGRERLYFDQQEIRRNAGLYSDLYSFDPATKRVRRLTHDARLIDPDISPDGRAIAVVRIRAGLRELVLVRLASADVVAEILPLVAEPDTQFNAPRWSPDGRSIVVERQRLGEQAALVLVDRATGVVRPLASGAETRWATPTWRRDGAAVIAAAATGDGPFNLFEIDVATLGTRQLTHTTGGATWPDVSPDGASIVYVGYTAGGFDLFQMRYPVATPSSPFAAAMNVEPRAPTKMEPRAFRPGVDSQPIPNIRRYAPWETLAPLSWLPTVGLSESSASVGAVTAGSDVLRYHSYSASAALHHERSAASSRAGSTVDWNLSYAYSRWQPSFFVSISSETSSLAGPPTDDGRPSAVTRRARTLETGVLLPFSRTRTSQVAFASYLRASDRLATAADERQFSRGATRLAWTFRSAHEFANSISPERGVTIGATTEVVRRGLGSIADATTSTVDARVYLPGLAPHHVVAVRAAGGVTRGDRLAGRTFLIGGGASNVNAMAFDSEALSLLRGFPADSFAGSHAALVNAEYRWPLVRVERGWGTWPIFLRTLHAAVFADLAHVWTREFAAGDLKTSFGAEISATVIAAYSVRLIVSAGVGRGHDGHHVLSDQTTYYARIGYAF